MANNVKNTLKQRTKYDSVDNRKVNKKNERKIRANMDKATKKA